MPDTGRVRGIIPPVAAVLLLAACGTDVVENRYVLAPAKGTMRVGAFDPMLGAARDDAKASVEPATSDAPAVMTVPMNASRALFDSGPPGDVRAGLYVPDITKRGYYVLVIAPVDGASTKATIPFNPWPGTPVDKQDQPGLDVKVATQAAQGSWRISITVQPPKKKKEPTESGQDSRS